MESIMHKIYIERQKIRTCRLLFARCDVLTYQELLDLSYSRGIAENRTAAGTYSLFSVSLFLSHDVRF